LRVSDARSKLAGAELRKCIHVGDQRTIEQDPKYALRLLVDIAIKALSPAINDPTTAVQAIDQIEDLLVRLAKCDLETSRTLDEDGKLLVIFQMPSWGDYLTLAFDEIRQYGKDSIQVMRRLRSAMVELADSAGSERALLVKRLSRATRSEHRTLRFRSSGSGDGTRRRSARLGPVAPTGGLRTASHPALSKASLSLTLPGTYLPSPDGQDF
jgi:uncharacterized membrane protein